MGRDEEIIKASTDTFKENGDEFAKVVQLFWISAFLAGAKWADEHPKNVWHSADEEPAVKDWKIIYEKKGGYYWVTSRYSVSVFYGNWQKFTEVNALTRWAYISELLPEGGE